ncbi:MAG: PilN domain-containing protein [Pseudomonadota bacterium]
MAIALGVFLLLGTALCGVWVWNLDRATASFQQSVATHTAEVDSLKAAIKLRKDSAAPADPALLAQLAARRTAVEQREKLRDALQDGMFRPGWGHSDRLTWVARSIPAPVWINDVRMDGARFEVSGFTLEPAALNEWVDKLSVSPLMQGLKLATVKVEKAAAAAIAVPSAAASATVVPAPAARSVWSFNLVSELPAAKAPQATASAPGSRP